MDLLMSLLALLPMMFGYLRTGVRINVYRLDVADTRLSFTCLVLVKLQQFSLTRGSIPFDKSSRVWVLISISISISITVSASRYLNPHECQIGRSLEDIGYGNRALNMQLSKSDSQFSLSLLASLRNPKKLSWISLEDSPSVTL